MLPKTFYIHTYGCQMNIRDSEGAASLLIEAGFTPVANEDDADIVIVNSCSVREKAEDKACGKLGILCYSKRMRPGRVVGLTGCMAQRMGKSIFKRIPHLDFSIGTRRAGAVVDAVKRVIAGETHLLMSSDAEAKPDIVPGHTPTQSFAGFVTILLGCNRRCAYCIVPDVRGPEYSRPAKDVLAEVRKLVAEGMCEITLLGQSIMNYGVRNEVWFDDDAPSPGGYTKPFPRLLEAVAAIAGIKRIRFTSGHPSGFSDELIRVMRDTPQVCHHLHLPVQSGSNDVLKRMRRGYTREAYLAAITKLREAIPDFVLTTDVIVGFPGETAEDFEQTRALMNEAQFDNSFIFKYSPRPGTPSAEWDDDVTDEEKRHRNQILLLDQDNRGKAMNDALIGSIQTVLCEGPSLRNQERWAGRNDGNKITIFEPTPETKVGDLLRIRITRAAAQTLYGDIV